MTTAIQQWDRQHIWHPYTRASNAAAGNVPVIVRGEGIHLFDDAGRRFVDAISSWWCAALGHGHPRLVKAIQQQAAELQHSILAHLTHPQAAELAQRLALLMPTPERHILFASDGASAVEQALKIAVQYWSNIGRGEKHRFACLHGAYHGDTLGAMAVGYLEDWHRPFKPMLSEAAQLTFPTDASDFSLWENTLARHRDALAAVIVEPLCLGAAGMRMYPAKWLRALADWCKANDVLLIDDEIAMGFGRTGRLFAFEYAGVDPDLVCVGKALTGGALPMSATIAKDFLYATFGDQPTDRTLQHGHTFCGNPIAAAAANEALRIYGEMGIAERAATLGTRMARQLDSLRGKPGIRDVRWLGLIGVVELESEAAGAAISRPHRIRLRLLEEGILLRPLGNVLYIMPPLIIEEEELDHLVASFAKAVLAECG